MVSRMSRSLTSGIDHPPDLDPVRVRESCPVESRETIISMPKKRHGVAQIIPKLRQADVELGKGKKVPEICKTLDISEQTYYRWRQKY